MEKYEFIKNKIIDYYRKEFKEIKLLLFSSDKCFTKTDVRKMLKLKWYQPIPREKHLISFSKILPIRYLDNIVYIDIEYLSKILSIYDDKILEFMNEIDRWAETYFAEMYKRDCFREYLTFENYIEYFPACYDILEKCKIKYAQIRLIYKFEFLDKK